MFIFGSESVQGLALMFIVLGYSIVSAPCVLGPTTKKTQGSPFSNVFDRCLLLEGL